MTEAEKFFLKQRDKFPKFIRLNERNYRLRGYKILGGGYIIDYTDIDWTTEDGSNGLRQNILSTMVHIKGEKPMIIEVGEFGNMVCEPDEMLAVERIISDFTRKLNGLREYKIILEDDTRSGETLYEKSF